MVYQIEEYVTETGKNLYRNWLSTLDNAIRARVQARFLRIQNGNLGDSKFFDGIGEARFDFGGGLRVYFARDGSTLILLLNGGNKSTQSKDIEIAKGLFDDYKRRENG